MASSLEYAASRDTDPKVPGAEIDEGKSETVGTLVKKVRLLIVPGIENSGPEHWQSYWEQLFPGATRVVQSDWHNPVADDWDHGLNDSIGQFPNENLVLVGHSLGAVCIARRAENRFKEAPDNKRICGALLVAPTDPETFPDNIKGFSPPPISQLPFPSIVVASENDPWIPIGRSRKFADAWGSHFLNAGKQGHINSASELGDWPSGRRLLWLLSH